jgi:hypothetical protein
MNNAKQVCMQVFIPSSFDQVALLAASINLGGYLAIISGRFYAAVQDRHNLGPR